MALAAVIFGGVYPLVGDLPALIEGFKSTLPFLVSCQMPHHACELRVSSVGAWMEAESISNAAGCPDQVLPHIPARLPLHGRRQAHRERTHAFNLSLQAYAPSGDYLAAEQTPLLILRCRSSPRHLLSAYPPLHAHQSPHTPHVPLTPWHSCAFAPPLLLPLFFPLRSGT